MSDDEIKNLLAEFPDEDTDPCMFTDKDRAIAALANLIYTLEHDSPPNFRGRKINSALAIARGVLQDLSQ